MLRFLHIEAASGILLIAATVVAMVWANSPVSNSYNDLWTTEVVVSVGDFITLESHEEGGEEAGGEEAGGHEEGGEEGAAEASGEEAAGETAGAGEGTDAAEEGEEEEGEEEAHGLTLREVVNDALMTVFFFVVGMEIKMELVRGQLRDRRAAALPAMAALGGMVVPALIYVALNVGGQVDGWGIPMATDIAFAVGVVSLLGPRVPASMKVFLLTLAIVDDIGAILVIALFYTESLSMGWLAVAVGLVVLMIVMQRVRIWYIPLYVVVGMAIWFAAFQSGVHATIAGVVMGLITPAVALRAAPVEETWTGLVLHDDELGASKVRRAQFEIRETVPVAERLIDVLHPFTSFVIIPIFALANAGIELSNETLSAAAESPVTWGVFLGLVVGKLVGVTLFTWLATVLRISSLPPGVNFGHISGIAAVAGIGFTVSIFITGLAFSDLATQDESKIGILAASIVAALVGLLILSRSSRDRRVRIEEALEQSADF